MRASAKLLSIAVIALFWVAQIQAAVHGISHLRLHAEFQDQAPAHSLLCADCVGYSQAGAAPVSEQGSPSFIYGVALVTQPTTGQPLERIPALGFRSRAPPTTSI